MQKTWLSKLCRLDIFDWLYFSYMRSVNFSCVHARACVGACFASAKEPPLLLFVAEEKLHNPLTEFAIAVQLYKSLLCNVFLV